MGGEKIVGAHYADDAVITIKQNCCLRSSKTSPGTKRPVARRLITVRHVVHGREGGNTALRHSVCQTCSSPAPTRLGGFCGPPPPFTKRPSGHHHAGRAQTRWQQTMATDRIVGLLLLDRTWFLAQDRIGGLHTYRNDRTPTSFANPFVVRISHFIFDLYFAHFTIFYFWVCTFF